MPQRNTAPRLAPATPLRRERERQKLSRARLAELVGCHEQTIVKYEKPGKELPKMWREKFAKALGVPEIRLSDLSSLVQSDTPIQWVPVISWASAGRAMEAIQDVDEDTPRVPVNTTKTGLLGLKVAGESMNRIAPNGSTIVYDPTEKHLVDGRYYIIRIGTDTTFKRYRGAKGPVRFEPDSNDLGFETIYPTEPFEIIGRVIKVINDV